MVLDKGKLGNLLGITSILPILLSVIVFYILRGPNTDIYLIITLYTILSVIGILLAVSSIVISKQRIIGIIGFITNIGVLACAFLLLLAMGISEP